MVPKLKSSRADAGHLNMPKRSLKWKGERFQLNKEEKNHAEVAKIYGKN